MRRFAWGAAAQAVSLALSLATMPQAYGSETLPLSRAQNDLWAEVGIGRTVLLCIVDTGASVTQIDISAFARSGARFVRQDYATFTTSTGAETHMIVGAASLRLGRVTLDGVSIALREAPNEAPCLLGQSALGRFPSVLIDFKRNRLVLETEEQ